MPKKFAFQQIDRQRSTMHWHKWFARRSLFDESPAQSTLYLFRPPSSTVAREGATNLTVSKTFARLANCPQFHQNYIFGPNVRAALHFPAQVYATATRV